MLDITTIKINSEVLRLIAEIDEFKGAWRALGTLAPERLSALRRVATIESIGSSTRIEGSKLSDREVESLLSRIEVKAFTSRDEEEVAGYAEVMETVFSSWGEIHLTENHIRQLHKDLLKYSSKDDWHRGNYKTTLNNIVAFDTEGKEVGTVFETVPPFATPKRMEELVLWFQEEIETKRIHALLLIGVFIVVFLEIHPFQDGNGRLSRILTTLLLLKAGYVYVPYSSLESIIEQSKESYYLALRQTQKTIRSDTTDWEPWTIFFLKSLHQQMKRLENKMEKEKLLMIQVPALSLQILDHVKSHGRISMKEAEIITSANRNTLKSHFKALIEKNMLRLHGKGRGAWYSLP